MLANMKSEEARVGRFGWLVNGCLLVYMDSVHSTGGNKTLKNMIPLCSARSNANVFVYFLIIPDAPIK